MLNAGSDKSGVKLGVKPESRPATTRKQTGTDLMPIQSRFQKSRIPGYARLCQKTIDPTP